MQKLVLKSKEADQKTLKQEKQTPKDESRKRNLS